MQWFKDWNISKKFAGIIVLFAAGFALTGFLGYYHTRQANNALQDTYHDSLLPIEQLSLSITNIRSLQGGLLELMVTNDPQREQAIVQDMKIRTDQNLQLLAQYEQTDLSAYEKDNLQKMKDELSQWRTTRQTVLDLALSGQKQAAYAYYVKNMAVHATNLNQLFDDSVAYKIKQAEEIKALNEQQAATANLLLAIIPVMAILLGSIAVHLVTRSISRRINTLLNGMTKIADGDLSHQDIPVTCLDEIDQVGQSMNVMLRNMQRLIQQIAGSSEQVAASSEELTASAQQSADAANQVANSITEIAHATDTQATSANQIMTVAQTMSEQANQISQTAKSVSATAIDTSQAANQGLQVVEKTVNQMNDIGNKTTATQTMIAELDQSSQKISEMVTLISSIAGQTNLLALNAAIEAARAGEQGRGFSVVAEEVRKLAEESNKAAQQIGTFVDANQANLTQVVAATQAGAAGIQAGISLVHDTGETFKRIVEAILHLSEQISDISNSIHDIATGNQKLVSSIQEIDTASKQSAAQSQTVSAATEEQSASMQQIAASSQSLAQLAGNLQTAIAKFQI